MKAKIKNLLLTTALIISLGACKKNSTAPEPVTPIEVKAIAITDLKALSTGASVKVPDGRKISGVVISDVTNKNIGSKTIVLQEATDKPGIIVNFDAAQTFSTGDQLEVTISNQTLTQVNGEIVLDKIPVANAKKIGTGTIAAKSTTTADIIKNGAALNGTLVKVLATGLSGGNGNYRGTLTITDASGTISSQVLSGATFENKVYPVLVNGIIGIVRAYGNIIRLDIRNTDDLVTSITRTVADDNFSKMIYTMSIGSRNFQPISPLSVDNNLDASKKYIYGGGDYQGAGGFTISGTDLAGLREVSLDIAYSKFTGESKIINNDFSGGIVYPFTSGKDVNQFSVTLDFSDFTIPLSFFKINDVGALHSISVQIPKTEADFKKAFLSSGMTEADYIANGYPDYLKTTQPTLAGIIISNGIGTFSDNYPATPQELEANKFINTRDNEPVKSIPAAGITRSTRPFAVGKITYGYEK